MVAEGEVFFFAPLPFYFENMTSVPSLFTTGENWFLVNMDLIFYQTKKNSCFVKHLKIEPSFILYL